MKHLGGHFTLKKVVVLFIVASALSIGFGSVESEASEWNQSSIKVEQSNSGWEKLIEIKSDKMDDFKSEFKGSASSMQSISSI